QEAGQTLRETFEALSSEALRRNNQSFLDLAKASLGEFRQSAAFDLESRQKAIAEMVSPIRQSLEKVDVKLQEVEKTRIGAYASLTEQVRSLGETQRRLQQETGRLVTALRTPSARGRWGEMQLHRVVEMAGMLDHCDFVEQRAADTDAGRLRPDLVVLLPAGKKIIVDAKAPLAAYLEAIDAAEEDKRDSCLANHARQVRDH